MASGFQELTELWLYWSWIEFMIMRFCTNYFAFLWFVCAYCRNYISRFGNSGFGPLQISCIKDLRFPDLYIYGFRNYRFGICTFTDLVNYGFEIYRFGITDLSGYRHESPWWNQSPESNRMILLSVAIIENIGSAHLRNFKSLEEIAEGKSNIVDGLYWNHLKTRHRHEGDEEA